MEESSTTRFMPPKRKRNALIGSNGFAAGDRPQYSALNGSRSSWGWVSSEVLDVDHITLEHRMTASNLSMRNGHPFCQNKFAVGRQESFVLVPTASNTAHINGELDEDIIVVSDTDEPLCTKKACKANPYCLNYLGQEMWEDEGMVHPPGALFFYDFQQILLGGTLSKLQNLVKILHFFPESPIYQ